MAFGVNSHDAQSSPWMKVPTTLHEGLDGLVVELVCPMFIICFDLLDIRHIHDCLICSLDMEMQYVSKIKYSLQSSFSNFLTWSINILLIHG
jgi:hypothetical protein